jgi:membrane fusion protein
MSSLFRPEAVAHNTKRLAGEVILAAPISSKLIGLSLSAIVLLAGSFAAVATYARTTSLMGWVVPDKGLVRAAATGTGVIQKIFVSEGDVVPEGKRIAEILLSAETVKGNAGENHIQGLQEEKAALNVRYAATIARLNAESEQTKERIPSYEREVEQVQAQISFQESRLKLAQTQEEAAKKLAGNGALSARDLEERQSAVLSIELEIAGLRRQVTGIQRNIDDSKARLEAIPIDLKAAQADHLSAQASLKERASDAEARRAIFVIAPMGGKIAALPVVDGQPVAIGTTIAVLTPAGGQLEAELLAPSRSIGFIREGQEVHLQLQAFPYERFGTLKGTVKTVSGTVLAPADVSIPGLSVSEPVFRVRVSLSADEIFAYGQHHPLQPGMLLAADVVLDRQSLLRWIFDPLYAVSRRT